MVRAASRANVYAPSRRAAILCRVLIADDLDLGDGFGAERYALASGAVVIVVQAVDSDVV
jgi:hypothetical protein